MSDPRDPAEEPGRDREARDEEALWRAIVDNYGERPVLDDLPAAEPPAPAVPVAPAPARREEPVELHDDHDDDHGDERGDADDHFVPPPPPRVPRATPARALAWTGLFGVPAIVLVLMVASITLPGWLGLLLMVWFVGGFVFLVASMKPDDRDGYDDGAVL